MTVAAELDGQALWRPGRRRVEQAGVTRFTAHVNGEHGLALDGYDPLYAWSVAEPDAFWRSIWSFFDVDAETAPRAVMGRRAMPGAEWFPGATLNYAHHALRHSPGQLAVIVEREDGVVEQLDFGTLRQEVGAAQRGLERLGVRQGDRVAALLPNGREALVAMLAAAGLGAIWTSCSPDHGGTAAAARFGQVQPRVLLTVDGYEYGGCRYSTADTLAELTASIPSIEAVVVVDRLGTRSEGTLGWDELVAEAAEPVLRPVAFDHPLWILYSSGTTGPPKAIVHGHGGILLEHFKALGLHTDVGPTDRLLWFTTTGWMMWNYLVSGLLLGTTVVLYDGSPGFPQADRLWELAERHQVTVFGTSAGYLEARRREGDGPIGSRRLALRTISSTGSPLAPEAARWAAEAVAEDVMVASVSGGSDVCSGLVGASPVLPVFADRIQRRMLGVAADAYRADGTPAAPGEPGELVITTPLPSMPVGLWGDADGSRYRTAYFGRFGGVWNHGDLFVLNADGSCAVLGRSDATLNRGGVRMGTAEFYAALEDYRPVRDSLVVDVNDTLWLLVVMEEDAVLDVAGLRSFIRTSLSPRHVPDRIEKVAAIPRTRTGKRLELPAKQVLLGRDPAEVADLSALENGDALSGLVVFRTPPDGEPSARGRDD